jgi:hypothetical protein
MEKCTDVVARVRSLVDSANLSRKYSRSSRWEAVQLALQEIADGHSDPVGLARAALGHPTPEKPEPRRWVPDEDPDLPF